MWKRLRAAGSLRRGSKSLESRLVWVFGSPRSGSTWLLRLLNGHSSVFTVNEPLIGDHLAPFISERVGVSPADLSVDNFTLPRLRRDVSSYVFATEFEEVWAPLLGELIRERLRAHARRYAPGIRLSKAFIAIKEPNGSQGAEMIMAALPRARLVFLLRDGRDVVDSELAAAAKGAWLSEIFPMTHGLDEAARMPLAVELAHKWLWRTEVVQATMRAHPGPTHLLRYEDLRSDTVGEMRRILDWLGLDIGERDLADLVEQNSFERIPAEQRGPSRFFRAAQPGLWRRNLSDEEQAAVEGVIGSKLRELGYTS